MAADCRVECTNSDGHLVRNKKYTPRGQPSIEGKKSFQVRAHYTPVHDNGEFLFETMTPSGGKIMN